MALLDKIVGAAVMAFVHELRETRKVLQDGIDTIRTVNGLAPLYNQPEPIVDAPRTLERPAIGSGAFLSAWLIQELAVEHRVKVDADTDLEALARERGWVNENGRFLMFPQSAEGLGMDADTLTELLP